MTRPKPHQQYLQQLGGTVPSSSDSLDEIAASKYEPTITSDLMYMILVSSDPRITTCTSCT